MIEDIDNRSDNKSFARYGEKPYDKVYKLNRRTIPFTWRINQNDFDCGVYCIKAMECYKENRRKQEVFKECALWSARKPFLIQQQKKRKDKENHLENLRVKRVEKVFLEDEKIRKERERHEQEVDDFLNNDFDDSP
ncbi:Ribosome-inactivating protein PMRIPm [Bienertia sinuspersici]